MTDVISLILAFFVLVFSMLGVEARQWHATVDALSRSLHPRPAEASLPTALRRIEREPDAPDGADLDYLRAVVADSIEALPDLAGLAVRRDGPRLILSLPVAGVFGGDGGLADDGRRRLTAIAGVLRHLDNAVAVIGVIGDRAEAADTPVPLPWPGALRQADAVAAELTAAGYHRRVDVLARWSGSGSDRVEIAVLATGAER